MLMFSLLDYVVGYGKCTSSTVIVGQNRRKMERGRKTEKADRIPVEGPEPTTAAPSPNTTGVA